MIFISYARADAAAAHRLAAELSEVGVPSLMDPPLPQGDVFWRDRLAAQMAPCAVMAALDSPAADASPWVQQERRGFTGAGGVLHGRADGAPGFVADLRAASRRHATQARLDPPRSAPDTDTDRIARANADDLSLARWQAAHPPHAKAANRDGDHAWVGDEAVAFVRAVPGQPGWYLALAPLSNAVYRCFVAASGRPPPATWARPSFAAPDLPATGMTWHDAAACAAWLGGELPPERVWRAAALAGGTGGEFATVDGGICARRAHHGEAFASGAPRAVDAYPATPAGYGGLCGNTWDWCADLWPDEAGRGDVPARRVIRGGGWMDDARFCRIDARYRNAAIDPDASVGLRLAWRAGATPSATEDTCMTEPKVELIGQARLLDDFFQVDAVDYRFQRQDGRTSAPVRRLVLERGDSVAALLHQGPRLWLVEQLRIATWPAGPGWLLEVVAGIVAAGESPETALRREVHEETGFEIEALDWLGSFYLSPGGSSERVHLALAEVGAAAGPGGGVAEEGEDIRLVELTPDGCDAWRQGRLVDAKTLIAAMAYFGARP